MRLFRVLPVLGLLLGAHASSLNSHIPAPHRRHRLDVQVDVRVTSDECASINTKLVVPDLLGILTTTTGSASTLTDLGIAPVLTLWITGTLGAAFPILAHSSRTKHIPRTIFEYIFAVLYHFVSYISTGLPNILALVS